MIKVFAYIRKIKNRDKQAYATTYAVWTAEGRRGTEPSRPSSLSVMGAQAVRLAINEILQ